jgi:hypothetical protein
MLTRDRTKVLCRPEEEPKLLNKSIGQNQSSWTDEGQKELDQVSTALNISWVEVATSSNSSRCDLACYLPTNE